MSFQDLDESCGTCMFYMAGAKVCRRYPPIPIMMGIKPGIAGISGDQPLIQGYFPQMLPTGWCGEYKVSPDETKDN